MDGKYRHRHTIESQIKIPISLLISMFSLEPSNRSVFSSRLVDWVCVLFRNESEWSEGKKIHLLIFFSVHLWKIEILSTSKKDSSNGKNAACIVFHVDGEERWSFPWWSQDHNIIHKIFFLSTRSQQHPTLHVVKCINKRKTHWMKDTQERWKIWAETR